jgi:Fe-S cluster assembly protein SufD
VQPTLFLDNLVSQFEKLEPFLPGEGQLALRKMRKAAFLEAQQNGLPSIRSPSWKHARFDTLLATPFDSYLHPAQKSDIANIAAYVGDEPHALNIVFLNGHFVSSLSDKPPVSLPVTLDALSKIAKKQPEFLHDLLNSSLVHGHFFQQLNASLCNDGALIIIPEKARPEKIINVYHFLVNESTQSTMIHPQTHIHMGKNSCAIVIERIMSLTKQPAWLNSHTKLTCDHGADLSLYRLIHHTPQTLGFHHLTSTQLAHSHLRVTEVALGADYQRHEMHFELLEASAELVCHGLMLPNTYQHCDWVSRLHHYASLGHSSQKMKAIVAHEGHSSFLGNITVNQAAEQTQTLMINDNLLLGDKGQVDSAPQLEILTDDVKCNHAATIGQLDENHLFYLQSRGLDYQQAQQMLLDAFIDEIVQSIEIETIRNDFLATIQQRLQTMARISNENNT